MPLAVGHATGRRGHGSDTSQAVGRAAQRRGWIYVRGGARWQWDSPLNRETGIVRYSSDLHRFPSHSEDRSGIRNCSRSARTQVLIKGGRIGLNRSKDRLAIGRIDLNHL